MGFSVGIRNAVLSASLILLIAGGSGGALAQGANSSDCILDNCADQKPIPGTGEQSNPAPPADAQPTDTDSSDSFVPRGRPRGSEAPGDFDFYVLALSWSPGFCATGGAEKARAQCADGANLGFVVHGLWPQNFRGYPSNCGPAGRYPSRIALDQTKGLYPDEGLARHEWAVHGTCSGKSPTDYFADVRRAREAITIPPQFVAPHDEQRWVPIDVQRAFIAANPRLRPGMMSIECTRTVLSEVRICMSKDLRNFVACPEVARHFCYGHPMTVPAVH